VQRTQSSGLLTSNLSGYIVGIYGTINYTGDGLWTSVYTVEDTGLTYAGTEVWTWRVYENTVTYPANGTVLPAYTTKDVTLTPADALLYDGYYLGVEVQSSLDTVTSIYSSGAIQIKNATGLLQFDDAPVEDTTVDINQVSVTVNDGTGGGDFSLVYFRYEIADDSVGTNSYVLEDWTQGATSVNIPAGLATKYIRPLLKMSDNSNPTLLEGEWIIIGA